MSILLDSLEKNKQGVKDDVPSVYDSHFDEEMLNDDSLINSIKIWKMISLILLMVLVFSWLFFVFSFQSAVHNIEHSDSASIIIKTENESPIVKEVEIENATVELDVSQNGSKAEIKSMDKQVYQPKKREVSRSDDISKKIEIGTNKPAVKSLDQVSRYDEKDVVYYEDLSTSLLSELPSIEINSYAVSSNTKKSFVVINGSFYGVGEVISPYLKIVEIDKKGILLEYKGRFIRKRHQ